MSTNVKTENEMLFSYDPNPIDKELEIYEKFKKRRKKYKRRTAELGQIQSMYCCDEWLYWNLKEYNCQFSKLYLGLEPDYDLLPLGLKILARIKAYDILLDGNTILMFPDLYYFICNTNNFDSAHRYPTFNVEDVKQYWTDTPYSIELINRVKITLNGYSFTPQYLPRFEDLPVDTAPGYFEYWGVPQNMTPSDALEEGCLHLLLV